MTPLAEWIKEQTLRRVGNRVTFKEFMEWALYHPTLGYYRRAGTKVGKGGDFYTSAHVGSVFGKAVAEFLNNLAKAFEGEQWAIVEFGSGDGKLADDILRYLREKPAVETLEGYYLVESSPYHQQLSDTRFKGDPLVRRVNRLDQAVTGHPLVVISNELIDAMPVHRLQYVDGNWGELYVTWNEGKGTFEEVVGECSTPDLVRYVQEEHPPDRDGQTIEVNLEAYRWLKELASSLSKGFVLTIDYGYEKDELWREERRRGTLMCYYRHRAVPNPYVRVGEQDMTSHVNFSSLKRWGRTFGLTPLKFVSQREFLVEAGILQSLRDHDNPDPFSETARRNRAIRQLIIPGGMGDTFKVLLQGKGI